jgi:hypothetical protein
MEKPFPSRTDFEDASYRAVQATSNALFTSWPNSRQSGSYVVSDEPLSPEEPSVLSPVWSTDLIPVDGCCSKRPDTLRQSA